MAERPKTPFIGTTRTEGLIVGGAIILPITILTSIFIGFDKGSIAGIAGGALACFVVISWPLRRERWFWIVFSIFTAVNAFAVAHFNWSFTHDWRGRATASLMVPDVAVMMAITYGVYCSIYGAPSEAVADLPDEGPSYSKRDIL
jgi:hypothetical protein